MKKRNVSDIEEEMIDKKKMKSKKTTHWGDLPKDIIWLIMDKLCLFERLCVGLVCNSWHEFFLEIHNTQEFLPWILCYYWNRKGHDFICKLGDPSTQRNYIVKETTMVQNRYFCGAVPCASRQGWVLFSEVLDFNSRLFFLYNPFTNEVIELPLLGKRYREATFSLSVNSSDCIVIAFWIQKQENLYIKTCRPGDESWKTFRYSGEYIPNSILKLAYAGEFFYCVFSDGKMGAFNIKQQSWKVLSHQLPMRFYDDLALFDAFNGDLLLSIRHGYRWKFWRFHLLETEWVVVEDEFIKKQVIFRAGHTSLAIPAVGNAEKYAARMLSMQWFDYGLADECYSNWGRDKLQKIWIQPPFQRTWRACDLLNSNKGRTT